MGRGKPLFTVQALRAIAAASVVVLHVLIVTVQRAGYSFSFPTFNAAGVHLFFLISGFIMIYTHFADFGQSGSPASFIRRRLIRIAPLYWIVTTVAVGLLIAFPKAFLSLTLDWHNVLLSYLFLLSRTPAGNINTVVVTGWSLCYEVYFYAIFAAFLFLPRKFFLAGTGAIFAAGLFLNAMVADVPAWATVATSPLLIEFYLGTIIALVFVAGFALPIGLAWVAIVAGFAIIPILGDPVGGDWSRVLIWGLPSAAILVGAVSLERAAIRVPKILVALGASSYSVYLTHPFVVVPIAKLWAILGLTQKLPAYVLALFLFGAALLIGHFVYLWLEKPITEKLKFRSVREASMEGMQREIVEQCKLNINPRNLINKFLVVVLKKAN
jgi:peptidoglycan/LPS O-acetylase OafA/YrhL